jgi:hypothetical protein
MSTNKKTKPSNRKVVFNKLTNKWDDLNLEDEKALMELEKAKQVQAAKDTFGDDDEPHNEMIMCKVCKEYCDSNDPCCP